MKKFTYEITVEAEDESAADSKMRGLSLLTGCGVLQKPPASALFPLSQKEEELIKLHRRGIKVLKLLGSFIEDPSRIDKLDTPESGNKKSEKDMTATPFI